MMGALAAIGGVVVLGLTQSTEVRGDTAPVTRSETYTHPELGVSFRYSPEVHRHRGAAGG